MKEIEVFRGEMREFTSTVNSFVDHYNNHLLKVVLDNHSDCVGCQKLIELGKVIEDEGKATKGISRTVNSFGNEAYVLVPKSWLGKKVKVSLIE